MRVFCYNASIMKFCFHNCHFSYKFFGFLLLLFSVFLINQGVTLSQTDLQEIGPDRPDGPSTDVGPGTTNILHAQYNVTIDEDTIILDGADYVIEEGDELVLLDVDDVYHLDASNGGDFGEGRYDIGEAIYRQGVPGDGSFDESDEVLSGQALASFPETPQQSLFQRAYGWLDVNTAGDSSFAFTDDEDMVAFGFNADAIVGDQPIRLFTDDELFMSRGRPLVGSEELFYSGAGNNEFTIEPAIIDDVDGDGWLSAGDTVLREGYGNINPLNADDHVCFSENIAEDGVFNYTDANNYETIWWNDGGDCTSPFTPGSDIIITGKIAGVDQGEASINAVPSVLFGGSEQSVGFFDYGGNELTDNPFTCGFAADECGEVVYTGDGSNWSSDSNFIETTVFFDMSNDPNGALNQSDSVQTIAADHINVLVDLSESNGGNYYFYIDSNGNTSYDYDEPIMWRVENGTGSGPANGQIMREFYDYNYKHLSPSAVTGEDWGTDFWADRGTLILDGDGDNFLDEGPMDGTGTDTIVFIGGEPIDETDFPYSRELQDVYYHDHDASSSFADGDDLIIHTSGSLLYNADRLESIYFRDSGIIVDEDTVSRVEIYTLTGDDCIDGSTDGLTSIGSYTGLAYYDQNLDVDDVIFYRSNNGSYQNAFCSYFDFSEDVYLGTRIGTIVDAADFASETVSFERGSGDLDVSVSVSPDVSIDITPGYTNQPNDVQFSFTSGGRILGGPGTDVVIMHGFPEEISVAGATTTCSINGADLEGMSMAQDDFDFGVFGDGEGGGDGPDIPVLNVVAFIGPLPNSYDANAEIVCNISGVTGPETAGSYLGGLTGAFRDDGSGENGMHLSFGEGVYVFFDEDVDDDPGKPRCLREDGCIPPVVTPPSYEVTVLTPNGGEVLRGGVEYVVTWESEQEEVDEVHIAFSSDGGESYADVVRNIPNTGSFTWVVPEGVDTQDALIRIQGVVEDKVRSSDVSDTPFAIIDPTRPYLNWRSPAADSKLQAGAEQWLLWESSPLIEEVELALSLDGGETYPIATERVENQNAYRVLVPSVEQDTSDVYVRLTGYADGYAPIEVLGGPFTIVQVIDNSEITVTYPNGLEAFRFGELIDIAWETIGSVPLVEVQFASNGTNWETISPPIENTGSLTWQVPEVASQYGFIRVGGTSSYGNFVGDTSDEPFWIIDPSPSSVEITSPNAGSEFLLGDVADIIWNSTDDIASANLYYQVADGARKAIALGIGNKNLYSWTIPELPVKTFSILLEGLDERGSVIATDSEGLFSFLAVSEPDPVIPEECGPGSSAGACPPEDVCTEGQSLVDGQCVSSQPPGGGDGDGDGDSDDDADDDGRTFISPDTDPDPADDSDADFDLAIFDQSGSDIYQGSIVPRVSAANRSVTFDVDQTIPAIVGSNLLIELVTDEPRSFLYATNDSRNGAFEEDASGIYYANVPIGRDTSHIKIQSLNLNPQYTLSLRVRPEARGSVEGLEEQDGSEVVVLSQVSAPWDASGTGQVNPARLAGDNSFAWYAPNGEYVVSLRRGDEVLTSRSIRVRNNIVNPALVLNGAEPTVSPIVDFLIPDALQEQLLDTIEVVRENPAVQTTAAVALPVSAGAAVASTVVLGSLFSLFNFLQSLLTTPLFFLSRRRRKSVGSVFNASTGVPVPFATIRFYDERNHIARTVVTNTKGQYSLSLPPGKYRPVVVKSGYRFPTDLSHVAGDNVYLNGFIEVQAADPFVRVDFPVDTDQVAEKIVSLSRVTLIRRLQQVISFVGVILSAYASIVNPSWINFGILALQLIIIVTATALSRVEFGHRIGRVVDKKGKPVAGVVVRLFEATYNKLIETQRTDAKGRYSFSAKDGRFYVVVETPKGNITSDTVDLRDSGELKPVAPPLKIA